MLKDLHTYSIYMWWNKIKLAYILLNKLYQQTRSSSVVLTLIECLSESAMDSCVVNHLHCDCCKNSLSAFLNTMSARRKPSRGHHSLLCQLILPLLITPHAL